VFDWLRGCVLSVQRLGKNYKSAFRFDGVSPTPFAVGCTLTPLRGYGFTVLFHHVTLAGWRQKNSPPKEGFPAGQKTNGGAFFRNLILLAKYCALLVRKKELHGRRVYYALVQAVFTLVKFGFTKV
jgi:hypothetical protein